MSHSTHQGVVRRAGGVSPTVNSVRFHLLAVTLLAASCAFDAAPEQEAVGASTEAILSGTPITAAQTPYVQVNPGCSGTLIRNDWVLTAGHCVPNSAESDPQTLSVVDLNQPSNTASARQVFRARGFDAALIRLANPMIVNGSTTGWRLPIAWGRASSHVGKAATCRGRGPSTCGGSDSGVLRQRTATLSNERRTFEELQIIPGITEGGDSGASCTISSGGQDYLVGMNVAGGCGASSNLLSAAVIKPYIYWVLSRYEFGAAQASGDFDGDGYAELAVSDPGAGVSGEVYLYEDEGVGSYTDSWTRRLSQNDVTVSSNEPGDDFGWALAAADFNNDGYDDLAVGTPGERWGLGPQAGTVYLFRGSASGLVYWHRLDQQTPNDISTGSNQPGERFGATLAVGNFANGSNPDLVVGAPRELRFNDGNDNLRPGGVHIFFSPAGSGSTVNLTYWKRYVGPSVDSDNAERLGFSLAVGDFDNDGNDDVAAGAVQDEATAGNRDPGLVRIWEPATNQTWWIQSPAVTWGEAFGWALAAADFNDDGADDLAVGAPGARIGSNTSGIVHVFLQNAAGLSYHHSLDQAGFSSSEDGDFLGGALTANDVDGDGWVELYAGAPAEDWGSNERGIVFVYEWSTSQAALQGQKYLLPSSSGYESFVGATLGTTTTFALFGWAQMVAVSGGGGTPVTLYGDSSIVEKDTLH